ncbi:SH3 domain-containing protein [Nodosilinea sp. P-1105]|uniref:SH3 domain-containing protein n=1 Tax=Nodosilinea sp. P-1105 TaxID=2546229 RepID=UPI00146D7989|nr:SH3 domain-containing protein [Nodosilinea sp. P-1105]NMF85235.1 SH3 domain-containing protein [Nodosilinea sp. P-1105]
MVLGLRTTGYRLAACLVLGVSLAGGLAACGGTNAEVDSPLSTEATVEQSSPDAMGSFNETVIEPVRRATLETQQPGAQVNVRSRPTTESPSQGMAAGGDPVDLLRLARGRDGYTWYYLTTVNGGTEGWVRGDFVDTSSPAATQATAPAATSTSPCGDDRQEAYFETRSFMVYLCSTDQGLRYVGTEKTTQEALVTQDVHQAQDTYIAIDGRVQYHINEQTLAVYQISNGSYSQMTAEPVLRHEQFLY